MERVEKIGAVGNNWRLSVEKCLCKELVAGTTTCAPKAIILFSIRTSMAMEDWKRIWGHKTAIFKQLNASAVLMLNHTASKSNYVNSTTSLGVTAEHWVDGSILLSSLKTCWKYLCFSMIFPGRPLCLYLEVLILDRLVDKVMYCTISFILALMNSRQYSSWTFTTSSASLPTGILKSYCSRKEFNTTLYTWHLLRSSSEVNIIFSSLASSPKALGSRAQPWSESVDSWMRQNCRLCPSTGARTGPSLTGKWRPVQSSLFATFVSGGLLSACI